MGKKGIETLVGLFVLLGMFGLVFLALKAANLTSFGGGDTYALTAKFDNIGGLKPRAAVKSAGVVVGRVTRIGFDDKTYQASVEIELEKLRAGLALDRAAAAAGWRRRPAGCRGLGSSMVVAHPRGPHPRSARPATPPASRR